MAAITIHSNFGAQKNKVSLCFHCFPIYLPWSDGTRWHDLSFLFLFHKALNQMLIWRLYWFWKINLQNDFSFSKLWKKNKIGTISFLNTQKNSPKKSFRCWVFPCGMCLNYKFNFFKIYIKHFGFSISSWVSFVCFSDTFHLNSPNVLTWSCSEYHLLCIYNIYIDGLFLFLFLVLVLLPSFFLISLTLSICIFC